MDGKGRTQERRLEYTEKVNWKGVGDEAFKGLTDDELIDYIHMLESTIYAIHSHFFYHNPRMTGETSVKLDDIGFTGDWKRIGLAALLASLRMYKLHKTPFVPVPKPESVRPNI